MKGLIKNKKTACLVMAVLAVVSVILMLFPGFAGDRQTSGRSVAYGLIKYGADTSSLDMDAVTEDIRSTIGKKVDVSLTTNISNGFDNIVIEAEPAVDIDVDALKALFDAKYPGLEIESFAAYKLGADRTELSVYLEMLLVLLCFCVLFVIYELLTKKSIRHMLTVFAVAVVSALVSLALVLIARIPLGKFAVITELTALIASALAACWQLNNYSVLSGGKKKNRQEAAGKAEGLGWSVTFEAAVFAVITLCGLFAGNLIAGTFGMFAMALCTALPIIVSAFAAQLFAIKLFAD